MEKSKKSLNVEGGFLFCGGWNFSKSVSVGPTFIREVRVCVYLRHMYHYEFNTKSTVYNSLRQMCTTKKSNSNR